MLVIGPNNPQAEKWFRFPSNVDFAHAMPPDQQSEPLDYRRGK
jgi:hypothetical protein